jgi:hypothetical protein
MPLRKTINIWVSTPTEQQNWPQLTDLLGAAEIKPMKPRQIPEFHKD